MVQILDRPQNFAEKFGMNLEKGLPAIQDLVSNYQKQKSIQNILFPQGQAGAQQAQPGATPDLGMGKKPDLGMGGQENQQQGLNITPEKILAIQQVDPGLAHTMALVYQGQEKEKAQARKEAFTREKEAEPKLQEMEEKLGREEAEGMRYDRLAQLFRPELESKFPSSFQVGLFSKDGELRPTAAALLSPEAQEAVKLVADSLSGAKDTFGARVTNFDVQSYMKRLPSLLNTAEGRRRVLRDLQLMNKINRVHDEGILDIVEKNGGPSKMPISKAERIFKQDYGQQIKELRDEFINPDKKSFSSMPDANMYSGRQMIDEETGQKFRSNGKEWVPE